MTNGILRETDIEPDMINAAFYEKPEDNHHTLGAGLGITEATPANPTDVGLVVTTGDFQLPDYEVVGLAALPVGTKVFIKSHIPELQDDTVHDAVGMVLGHAEDGDVQLLTLSPKDGAGWGMHNAYGGFSHELPDALAALDRLFHPERDFGAIAVLSEVTGGLLVNGAEDSGSVGKAGCNSHNTKRVPSTLSASQLLDTYNWKPIELHGNSGLVRRDESGRIMHLLPGDELPNQPGQEQRDQRSVLDRIDRLTRPGSVFAADEVTPVDLLRGIEGAVGSGLFADRETPIAVISNSIRSGVEGVIA